jgi:hypothetical protein
MVDTGCPRAGYRHIAFHSRGCVEPQRSGREERDKSISDNRNTQANVAVNHKRRGREKGTEERDSGRDRY